MTFGFALVLGGFILLDAGWKGTTPAGVLRGVTEGMPKGAGGVLAATGRDVMASFTGSGGSKESPVSKGGPRVKGGKLTPAGVAAGVAKATSMTGRYPYVWGGGHQTIGQPSGGPPPGYDCSGAVCAVLNAMGMLENVMVSGELASWGEPGVGKTVTVYANATHTFMKIGGVWFGTGSDKEALRGGAAWGNHDPELAAYSARHPKGG